MNMNSESSDESASELGVADYYNRRPRRPTSRLVGLAPDLLILARCEGAPETARYFSERLKVPVTEKMIKGIKTKVAMGLLIVTREELEAAALSHPISAARMLREPAICDPQHYRAVTTPRNPQPEETDTRKSSSRKREQRTKARATEIPPAENGDKPPDETVRGTTGQPPPTGEMYRELARLEDENQRRPWEQKAEPKPPEFRGTPPPSKDATAAESEAWKAKRKQEREDYIKRVRKEGWEISPEWNGYGSAAKHAVWVGPET